MTSNKDENVVSLHRAKSVDIEAAEWLMRLEDAGDDQKLQAEFLAWQSNSPQRRDAVQRQSAVWGGLDCLAALNAQADSEAVTEARRGDCERFPPSVQRRWFLAAASLALVVGVGAVVQRYAWPNPNFEGAYQTAVGEQREIELPDGSVVELNTNSQVKVAYSKAAREIRLVRGEAFFEVAKNKERPFSVYAGNGVVTAVGTAFSVHLKENKVDVLVSEGRVALASAPAPAEIDTPEHTPENKRPSLKPLAEISAGEGALFSEYIERRDQLEQAALKRKLSWRGGVLSFAGEPLADVIADVSRYTDIEIIIADDDLRALPIAGYFPIGETEALFEALEVMADIKVERISAKQVSLSRAS